LTFWSPSKSEYPNFPRPRAQPARDPCMVNLPIDLQLNPDRRNCHSEQPQTMENSDEELSF
jgi:hypothetical protein